MTALALCVRVKRLDGKILRTTSHDRDIVVTAAGYEGTYRSVAALATSDMQFRPVLSVDGMDIAGILSEATGISERDLAASVYDQARWTVFEVDLANLSAVREWVWGVGGKKTRTEEGRLSMEIRTISQLLNQNQGEVWQTRCRAEVGAGSEATPLRQCHVDMTAFTFDDVVTSVLDARKAFVVAGLTQDAGYFSKGRVTWLTGDNEGAVREIRLHDAGGLVLLYDPLPFDIAIGDNLRVEAGDDKRFETCRDKFDNAINFQGEPYIPGPAFMSRNNATQGSIKPGGQSLLGSLVQLAAMIVGSLFGPIGTFIGSLIGAILAPVSGGSSEGPRAQDLKVTSSTEGLRIPWVGGRYPVAGNVLTDIEIIEEKSTRRVGANLFSSGTKITEYHHFFTGFVGLGEGEMDVIRIWAYGNLIYDVRPVAEREAEFIARMESVNFTLIGFNVSLQITTDLNAELDKYMTIYRGDGDQLPDPVLEEYYGVGNVPGFRHRAGLMFNRLPVSPYGAGAVPPQLLVEVCRPLPLVEIGPLDDDNTGEDVLGVT